LNLRLVRFKIKCPTPWDLNLPNTSILATPSALVSIWCIVKGEYRGLVLFDSIAKD